MKIIFPVSRIQGLFGAGHEKNHQKIKKIQKITRTGPIPGPDIRTGIPGVAGSGEGAKHLKVRHLKVGHLRGGGEQGGAEPIHEYVVSVCFGLRSDARLERNVFALASTMIITPFQFLQKMIPRWGGRNLLEHHQMKRYLIDYQQHRSLEHW